jgi:hypothetical protein
MKNAVPRSNVEGDTVCVRTIEGACDWDADCRYIFVDDLPRNTFRVAISVWSLKMVSLSFFGHARLALHVFTIVHLQFYKLKVKIQKTSTSCCESDKQLKGKVCYNYLEKN